MTLDDQRAELKSVRQEIAERNQELANRVLDARILRAKLESELRTTLTKTDAEKEAKLHPEYVTFERETARLEYERDIAVADAESRAYGVQAAILSTAVMV